jgi:hypothetical protein
MASGRVQKLLALEIMKAGRVPADRSRPAGSDPTAQAMAWREAADQFHNQAAKVAAARRADIDAAVTQMKADAAEAEARLQKLKQTGNESWAALSAALAESRNAFDRASQRAWDALKRAVPPKS